MEIEKKMIEFGYVTTLEPFTIRAIMALREKRHGYQPFYIGKKTIFVNFGAYPIPKGVSWFDDMNMAVHRLKDAGIIGFIKESYILPRHREDEKEDRRQTKPFTLEHVAGPIVILLVGLFLSSLIYLVEITQKKKDLPKIKLPPNVNHETNV